MITSGFLTSKLVRGAILCPLHPRAKIMVKPYYVLGVFIPSPGRCGALLRGADLGADPAGKAGKHLDALRWGPAPGQCLSFCSFPATAVEHQTTSYIPTPGRGSKGQLPPGGPDKTLSLARLYLSTTSSGRNPALHQRESPL